MLGGTFISLCLAGSNQASIQRYLVVRDARQAKMLVKIKPTMEHLI